MSQGSVDAVRLQDTLDEVAFMVEWAAEYIEYLEEEELRWRPLSDLPVLKADLERLRLVADALEPGRVRDANGNHWYLAPDDAARRPRAIEALLDAADEGRSRAQLDQDHARKKAKEDSQAEEQRRARDAVARREKEAEQEAQVRAYLATNGPSTLTQIVRATGLSALEAEQAAMAVAKRGRSKRYST